MNTKKNEFFIGLAMSVATLIVIVGILVLGKSNFFLTGLSVNVVVNNADGISQGDDVYFKGLKVGSVSDAKLLNDNIILSLKIEGVDSIPVDSKFEIKDFSILGGKAIEILPGNSKECLKEDARVYGYTSQSGIASIVSDIKKLEPKIDKILDNIDNLTGENNQTKVKNLLNNLSETINGTKKVITVDLHNTLTGLNDLTTENKENVHNLLKSLTKSSDSLSTFLGKSSSVILELDSLMSKLNSGKGSAGNFLNNESLYHNLNKTIISIDSLVSDVKKNPDKYINVSVF